MLSQQESLLMHLKSAPGNLLWGEPGSILGEGPATAQPLQISYTFQYATGHQIGELSQHGFFSKDFK